MNDPGYVAALIIGAPRSGTNMLRNVLTQVPGIGTWPCDEINYIWRYGNARYPNDELTADMATDEIRDYIRKQFDWVRRRYSARIVVEKTCANSLRVGFVESVLTDPKYIFIYRDAVDAVASAMLRWHAKMDTAYILAKARFVPVTDVPFYATRFFRNRLGRRLSVNGQLPVWGPVTADLHDHRGRLTLAEVCAHQWSACVERALETFDMLAPERVLRIPYEELVEDRFAYAARLARFLNLEEDAVLRVPAFAGMKADSVGKGRQLLDPEAIGDIEAIAGPMMSRLGYR